jgi:hypothetical protein
MQTRKLAWWQLYLLIPIMFGLIGLEVVRPLPGVPSEAVVAGIVLLFFAAVLVWVHVNGGLLEWKAIDEEGSPDHFKVTVIGPDSAYDGWTNYQDPMPVLTSHEQSSSRERLTGEKRSDIWSLN